MENKDKPWNRCWEIDEIVNNANNWSLAADAGLLKHLEKFSENLFANADETNSNLNNLLNNLESTSLKLDIARNKFLSLQNTQFIESRVYEDDEIGETQEETESDDNNKKKDELNVDNLKVAVLKGIDIMNKYYDKVDVPASDSEDDDNDIPNIILRPKDPYIERPLPYIIGTEEWYKKWHVGLEDTSSEGESEKLSEEFSNSDSESDLLYLNQPQAKTASRRYSEDFSEKLNQPVANSTLNDTTKPDIFNSSDSEDNHSYPSQPHASNGNFARQLSKKLGNILQNEPIEDEVNTRPIQKVNTNNSNYVANTFSDEPPPLEEFGDETFSNPSTGIFSGGKGLFDDDENDKDSLWSNDIKQTKQAPEPQNLLKPNKSSASKVTKGLFDDTDSEDDLFSTNRIKSETQKPYLTSVSTSIPFTADEPPDLEASDDKNKKKPIGGIAPFGNVNLFGEQNLGDVLKNIKKDSPLALEKEPNENLFNSVEVPQKESIKKSPDKVVDDKKESPSETPKVLEKPKESKSSNKISIFDDDGDDLFKDDFLTSVSTKKFSSNIFDSDSDDDFISRSDDEKQKLFQNDKMQGLFSNDEPEQNLLTNQNFIQENEKQSDVFNAASYEQNSPLPDVENTLPPDVVESNNEKSYQVDLFGSSPPPMDDDWDINVDNVEDNVPYESSIVNTRSSLFDDEPPSLFLNETSGIVKDVSNRTEQDGSFLPPASSTRRFSTEISEQFSADYFLTKTSINPPPLHTILEPENCGEESKIDITPSGVSNELYSETTSKFENDEPPEDVFGHDGAQTTEPEQNIKKLLPGKLTHNLNINVSALLPGAHKAKKVDDLKEEKANVAAVPENDSSPSDNIIQGVETLPSITKNRAKIVTKRRPSTRRGRQEQLRKAEVDFNLPSEADANEVSHENSEAPQKIEPVLQQNLFDEPLPIVPQFEPPYTNKRELIADKPMTSSLFDDFLDEEDDLFSGRNVTKIQSSNLFDDNASRIEANADLTNKAAVSPLISNITEEKLISKKQNSPARTIGLFDDDMLPPQYVKQKSTNNFLDDNSSSILSHENFTTKADTPPLLTNNPDDSAFEETVIPKKQIAKRNSPPKTKGLFDDDDDDDDDMSLFSNNNNATKNKKSKSTLFDDNREANDETSNIFNKNTIKTQNKPAKASLFEDNDSDDDIFGKHGTTPQKHTRVSKVPPDVKKKTSITKKTLEAIDDPLNVFKN